MKAAACLGVLLAFSAISTAEAEAEYAPAEAFAFQMGPSMWIAWTPGEATAPSYHLFGVTEEGWMLLAEYVPTSANGTVPMAAEVPTGYAMYGVAGVQGGVRSPITAASEPGGPCIYVMWDPPAVWHDCELPDVERSVGIDFYPAGIARLPLPME